MDSARKWSGYVCPDCRFVFRVPRDHDGQGVVCPGCRRMLKIPPPGARLPPLVVPIRGAAPDSQDPGRTSEKSGKRRKKRKGRHGSGNDWDNDSSESHVSGKRENRQMFWMMIGGATLFALIVAGVMVAMLHGDPPEPFTPDMSLPDQPNGLEVPEVVEKSDVVLIAEAEPVVRGFMDAKRIEDMLPFVRHPEVTEERMRDFYPNGRIEAPGVSAYNTEGQLLRQGAIRKVMIRTRDFEDRAVSFLETPDGIRIDWESWVGWSEIPWDRFLATKPTEAKLFRVKLSPVDYYNFMFSDDVKWHSYRLAPPDGETQIYGYAEIGTVLDSRIRPGPDVKEVNLTLTLRFPEEGTSRNQVIIDRLVTEGWVIENEETP